MDLAERAPNGVPLPAPSCSTSSCSLTSTAPSGSESSGATHESRTFAELLIDCEEDRTLRAVLVGDAARGGPLETLVGSSILGFWSVGTRHGC